MKITLSEEKDHYLIKLSGKDTTTENIEEFKGAIDKVVKAPSPRPLVLDLGELHYLGSEGVGIIASAHRNLSEHGRKLVIKNPTPPVSRVLVVTRLDSFLHIEHDQPEP